MASRGSRERKTPRTEGRLRSRDTDPGGCGGPPSPLTPGGTHAPNPPAVGDRPRLSEHRPTHACALPFPFQRAPGWEPRPAAPRRPAPPRCARRPRGRSLGPAPSQPRSQPAPRGPTRACPVTHLCRANSSQPFPSHTLTPGSRWRRRRQRRRRGTQTPGVSRSSGPSAGCDGPAPTRVLTRPGLFRRRGHVLCGGPGAEGRGRRHGRRGPLGRRGRGRGREGRCGPGRRAARMSAGCGLAARLGTPGCRPGLRAVGPRVSVGWAGPRFPRPAGHVGSRRRRVRPDSAEGGHDPDPSPSPEGPLPGLDPNWRREVTAAVGSAHVQASQFRSPHRNEPIGNSVPMFVPYGKS